MQLDRLLTLIFASLAGLVVLAIGIDQLFPDDSASHDSADVAAPKMPSLAASDFTLRPIDTFDSIHISPLFRPDRQQPAEDETEGAEGESVATEVASESKLDVVLTGVVMSPDYQFALLKDNTSSKSVTLKAGDNFEGELAAWKLGEIEPRKVTFEDNKGATEAVELKVNTTSLGKTVARTKKSAAGRTKPGEKNEKGKAGVNKPDTKANTEADEIRRKVATRRARMRAEAAKKKASKNNQ